MGIFRFYADCAFVAHLSGRKAISGVFRKIAGVQAVVTALLGNQLIVGAALNNAALFQHHDAVRVAHGGKAVGDNKGGAAIHQAVHALLHQALGAGINAGGCFVQDQYRRVRNSGTGNGKQLALALAQVGAVAGQRGVIAIRQVADELIGVGQLGGGAAFLVRCIQAAIADVIHNRTGKQVVSCRTMPKDARRSSL